MRRTITVAGTVLLVNCAMLLPSWGAEALVEAAAFDEYGDWILNSQLVDQMHHGNTEMFRTRLTNEPVSFPEVPWATAVPRITPIWADS